MAKPLTPIFFAAVFISVVALFIFVAVVVQAPVCDIKGNITLAGEKVYHLKGTPFYSTTIINSMRGEKYFCTEDAAKEAGWRKALAP